MAEPIRYHVDLSRRAQHLVGVRMTVPADLAGERLVFPTWTPGSYVIRDYVHHLQRIDATGPDGRALALVPDGVTAWRLPAGPGGAVTVSLELYANELTVRTNHVDDHHALLVPPATFPYVVGAEERRHVVHLPPPDGHRVHTLLPAADEPDTWEAGDLHRLVDAVFEVGDHAWVDYEVAGVPHRFVWAAEAGRADLESVASDAAAIGTAAVELFDGDLPVDDYTFVCEAAPDGGGGLEHRDGATLMVPLTTFQQPDLRRRLAGLIAHEYLHLWNGKRLVPTGLDDLDYLHPAPTGSLWVVEGWTCYYDALLPLRAGAWPLDHFLDTVADRVDRVVRAPAARLQSVRDAGRQAWVKHYVRDENTVNSSVDYYAHGAVLAWCLDLMIRRTDPGGAGLDGVVAALWRRFGATGRSYDEEAVRAACEEAAGRDLGDFFAESVGSPGAPPIGDLVSAVGLRLADRDQEPPVPRLGARLDSDGDGTTIEAVLRGGPAWEAGLTGGDRLLAVDGLRVGDDPRPVLAGHEPGETITVTVFRGPRLRRAEVTLGAPRPSRRLVAVPDPSSDQRAAFSAWTGRDLGDVPG